MTFRYKITIEYDGTNYIGWQKQEYETKDGYSGKRSIGGVLQEVIFSLTQEKIELFASGRTDAGVHAIAQIAHFDSTKKFQPHQIIFGLNNYLLNHKNSSGKSGSGIVITDCEIVDENFHSRFSAKKRHYFYRIINRKAPLVIEKNRALHVANKLNISAMQEAAQYLVGEHDFSAFRDAECQAKSAIKTIDEINISQNADEIKVTIAAKSFLHHMVRNIVGTLIWVGSDKINACEVKNILLSKNRLNSGPNVAACGLYFYRTDY